MHATASVELVIDSLLPNLLQGDRATVRTQVARALGDGLAAEDFTEQVAWPLHESLQRVMLFCGSGENEDLGGQMAADLLEAAGYEVFFAGGGVARDEILEETHRRTPDFLVLFASSAADAPTIRAIIDQVREVGAHPGLQIAVGGGVFNRADGLAEAIGATRFARTPMELVRALAAPPAAARHAIGEPRRARAVA